MAFENEGLRSLRPSVVAGARAWVIGLTVAVVLLALFSGFSTDPGTLFSTGVVFYFTFHLWPLVFVPSGLGATAAIFAPFTMVLLFWSGFRTTVRADLHHEESGFRYGARITIGYLALALLSAPILFYTVEVSPLEDPLVTVAILVTTGVLFPVVFGGLGGWIAER